MLSGYQVKVIQSLQPNKKKWIFPAPKKPATPKDQEERA